MLLQLLIIACSTGSPKPPVVELRSDAVIVDEQVLGTFAEGAPTLGRTANRLTIASKQHDLRVFTVSPDVPASHVAWALNALARNDSPIVINDQVSLTYPRLAHAPLDSIKDKCRLSVLLVDGSDVAFWSVPGEVPGNTYLYPEWPFWREGELSCVDARKNWAVNVDGSCSHRLVVTSINTMWSEVEPILVGADTPPLSLWVRTMSSTMWGC